VFPEVRSGLSLIPLEREPHNRVLCGFLSDVRQSSPKHEDAEVTSAFRGTRRSLTVTYPEQSAGAI